MEYINDRTITNVEELRRTNATGWDNLTEEEKTKWFTDSKGAINAGDLNRIVNNLIETKQLIEQTINQTVSAVAPKNDWTMQDIPTREELQKIANYYNIIYNYCLIEYFGVDVFRFCTVDKLNSFETEIFNAYKFVETLKKNGMYEIELEWQKNDDNFVSTKQRLGLFDMMAIIPPGSTLTVNKYIPNGDINETDTYSSNDGYVTIEFKGSSYLEYEFICDMGRPTVYYKV